MSAGTTMDTEVREDGGRAVLVARYVLPALYTLLWSSRQTQGPVSLCARPDCGEVLR